MRRFMLAIVLALTASTAAGQVIILDVSGVKAGRYYYQIDVGVDGQITLTPIAQVVRLGSPSPTPTPTPTPTPVPTPTPTPTPTNPFRDAVSAALSLVPQSERDAASRIAGIYTSIAAEAVATASEWTVSRMVGESKTRCATVLSIDDLASWRPFWTRLASALTALKLEDSDIEKAAAAFGEIAIVLEAGK